MIDPAEGGVHRPPEGRTDPDAADDRRDPDRRRAGTDPVDSVLQRRLLDVGEEPLDVEDHAVLDVGAVHHLAEDEEDEQREREDREHQVVGDHPGEPGDVLLVGAVPERSQPRPSPELPTLVGSGLGTARGPDVHA